jgi:hypothetical protein
MHLFQDSTTLYALLLKRQYDATLCASAAFEQARFGRPRLDVNNQCAVTPVGMGHSAHCYQIADRGLDRGLDWSQSPKGHPLTLRSL